METDFSKVNLLRERKIEKGEKWVYVADFNTEYSVSSDGKVRVENPLKFACELEDLSYLLENGASIAILAHQGRFSDGSARHLDFAAKFLSELLDREVNYFPENSTSKAARFVKKLQPGEIAIMGNTRFHEGEEKNDPELARKFARLGEAVAEGGFAKSHRENASNIGILEYRKGYLTEGQRKEMESLKKWAGKSGKFSVAVLGGAKKEKITTGLRGFSEIYDAVIPGGIVLNTIYRFLGYEIGSSLISEKGKTYEKYVEEVFRIPEKRKKVILPERVIVAKRKDGGFEEIEEVPITRGVKRGYMIVDFSLPAEAHEALERAAEENGRIVIAGTPTLYKHGFTRATDEIVKYAERCEQALLLGGDTIAEIKFNGFKSPGGGAALYYLVHGTTKVFEALKRNRERFK